MGSKVPYADNTTVSDDVCYRFAMLIPILALAMMQPSCPLYVGVGNDGNIFYDQFQGWVRADANLLEGVLQQGCRTNFGSEPKPITSVRLAVAPKAPREKIDAVFTILERNGWTREKIAVEPWISYTRKLAGHFYIDKSTFSRGEPVLLHFEVINSGSEPYWLDTTGLPGMPGCSGYIVKVLPEPTRGVTRDRLMRGNTCILNGQFKHVVIAPGGTYTQDIDLGLYLDLSVKGNYVIQVEHYPMRRNGVPDDPLDCKATFKLQLQ
jgi:hypothetical protein